MVEFNYIVRVIGKDLDGTKSVESGLQGIKGIGQRVGGIIANEFRKEAKVSKAKRLGELTPEEIKKLHQSPKHYVAFAKEHRNASRPIIRNFGK